MYFSFPLHLSPMLAFHFPLVWPSRSHFGKNPFGYSLVPSLHTTGVCVGGGGHIHLGYVIPVTPRVCVK